MIRFVFLTACSGYYVENEPYEHKNGARGTIQMVFQESKQEVKTDRLEEECRL